MKRSSWAGTPSGTGPSCWRRPSREADWVGEVGVVGGVAGPVDLVGGVGFVDGGDDVRVAGLPVEVSGLPVEKVGKATGVIVGKGVALPGEDGRGVPACVAGGP
jgi:hypothetical protein